MRIIGDVLRRFAWAEGLFTLYKGVICRGVHGLRALRRSVHAQKFQIYGELSAHWDRDRPNVYLMAAAIHIGETS
jgi:hypothetical protein